MTSSCISSPSMMPPNIRPTALVLESLLQSLDPVQAAHSILTNHELAKHLKKELKILITENSSTALASVYRCTQLGCKYGCTSNAELRYHIRTHANPLNCGLCDHISSNKQDLDIHSCCHQKAFTLRCSQCPYMTCTQSLLSEHIHLIHNTSYNHICTMCGFETNTGSDVINLHIASHVSAPSKPYNTRARRKISAYATTAKEKSPQTQRGQGKTVKDVPAIEVIPKQEPLEEAASDQLSTGATDPKMSYSSALVKYGSTIESVVAGDGNFSLSDRDMVDETDRAPWWDTQTHVIPPFLLTAELNHTDSEDKVQCTACGELYQSHDRVSHQCTVVKHQLITNPLKCTLCDFSTSQKKDLVKHCIDLHSRSWTSLVIKLKGNSESIDHLCQTVEEYVPHRYKDSACNLYVTFENDNEEAATDTAMLYRCTKCYKCFGSLDLQAGHKLLDQCHSTTSIPLSLQCKYSCMACNVQYTTTDDFTAHHLQRHTTINSLDTYKPDLFSVGRCTPSNSSSVEPGNQGSRQFTEDALLMIDALQRVGADNSEPTDSTDSTLAVSAAAPQMIKAKIVAGDFQMCCQSCEFTADSTERYMNHVMSDHCHITSELSSDTPSTSSVPTTCLLLSASMQTLYGCNFCDYICDQTSKLTSHMANHAGRRQISKSSSSKQPRLCPSDEAGKTEEKPVLLCQACGFQTTSKSSLRSHVLNHNINQKKFQCDECEFTSQHASSLKIHMRSHTGYKPFICSMCGKCFITNSELRKHERRHAGPVERKHSCDICGKKYTTSQHLKVHLRRHTGDRPFKCDQCYFAATSKSVLMNHRSVHTGEKNYKCHLCIFTCASSGTLSNHRRLKHNIVNKRTTLAETTPESILLAATVAGKSKGSSVPDGDTQTDGAVTPRSRTKGSRSKSNSVGYTVILPNQNSPSTNQNTVLPILSISSANQNTGIPISAVSTNHNMVMSSQCQVDQNTGIPISAVQTNQTARFPMVAASENVRHLIPGSYQLLPTEYHVLEAVSGNLSQQQTEQSMEMEGQMPYVSVIQQQPVGL